MSQLIIYVLSCFLIASCQAQCSTNEVLKDEGIDCLTCENYMYARCVVLNETRCYCLDGYVRNALGQCVQTTDCPPPQGNCAPNETLKDEGIDCLTCENYLFAKCALIHETRCYCLDGYVRNSQGQCVSTEDCPTAVSLALVKCAANETLERHGIDCLTCDNYMIAKCALIHETRCYCLSGYVTDSIGWCISATDCPGKGNCAVNETYKQQGFDCQTCDNYMFVKCMLLEEPRCYCLDGYVRNSEGRCIQTTDCPATVQCAANETYAQQGFDCQTCDNYMYVKCMLLEEPRCYCLGGYVRNSKGQCIETIDCPAKVQCAANETYREQGFDCQTCDNYMYVRCMLLEEPKCYCLDGYVRNSEGQCVQTTDCPAEGTECTKPNERYAPCFSKYCEKTCRNTHVHRSCRKPCRKGGCVCKKGFVRDNGSGECIDENSCP